MSNDMQPRTPGPVLSLLGTYLITAVFILASLVGFLSVLVPEVAAYTSSRFGAIGLILCLNPLIFLVPTLRNPTVSNFAASAFMTLVIGLVDYFFMLVIGESQWTYTVLPFVIAGVYLAWQAIKRLGVAPLQNEENATTDSD
jgi:hypothetical protein